MSRAAPESLIPPGEQPAVWLYFYDPTSRREWLKLLLLLVITIAAYVPALRADFVWQDDVNLTANPAARSSASLAWSWAHPKARPIYRPLADTLALPQQLL